ncbi:RDD family protein [Nocardia sp. NPDC051981]|uniref:RDD family protein n=1 Tax=Nocardia sp. NPDC051981 TaxID=3155417 RepID=UPI003431EC88
MRHPWKRLAAWFIDCLLILLFAGLIAAVCVPLYLAGVTGAMPQPVGNAVSALVLVVPAVLVLAALEAGHKAATIGKLAMKLHLTDSDGTQVTYPRALARNTMKFGAPWLIAHAAVYALASSSAQGVIPGWIWPLLALAYAIPIVWILSLFVGTGRTPYDRLTHTTVSATPDI